MKKLSDILTELGIAFDFPIEIKNADGKDTYREYSDGSWAKYEYDANGNKTYHECNLGFWRYSEYDDNGNQTYYKENNGSWWKCEYDENNNKTYYEHCSGYKEGTPRLAKTAETTDDLRDCIREGKDNAEKSNILCKQDSSNIL